MDAPSRTMLAMLLVACASAPKVPPMWEKQYGGRADCRGSSGTECFLYFKLIRHDPNPICQAESPYPGNMRRSECYQAFQVADPGWLAPEVLVSAIVRPGPDQSVALGTLQTQASRGDAPSLHALRALALERTEIPRREQILSWLVERGDAKAFEELVARALDTKFPRRVDYLAQVARLPGKVVVGYLLQAMASPDAELSRMAMAYAQSRPGVAPEDLWRAALRAALRANAAECRKHLREHLRTKPRPTLLALSRLRSDSEIGPIAAELLTMALGSATEPVDGLSESRLNAVSLWATAGRLPRYLPRIEQEAEVVRSEAEEEKFRLERVRLGRTMVVNPSQPGRLYVATEGDGWPYEAVVLAEVRGPSGESRWLLVEPHVIGHRDYCEPLPGKCRFPSWLPEGSYVVFSDRSPHPIFPTAGRYEVTFESAHSTFRFGPLVFGASRAP